MRAASAGVPVAPSSLAGREPRGSRHRSPRGDDARAGGTGPDRGPAFAPPITR
ncbi:MAG: hypothetical protein R3F14_24130 [Polyangiaceae bacterium]